jgi:hypothetical protein
MPELISISDGQDFLRIITPPTGQRIRSVTLDGVPQLIADPYRFELRLEDVSADMAVDVCFEDIPTTPPATLRWSACGFSAGFVGDGVTSAFLVEHLKNTRHLIAEVYQLPDYDTIGTQIQRTSEQAITVGFVAPPAVGEEFEVAITWLAQTTGDCGPSAFTATFGGDGLTTEFVILHELGTRRLVTAVYDLSTEEQIGVGILRDTDDQLRVVFSAPPLPSETFEIVIR